MQVDLAQDSKEWMKRTRSTPDVGGGGGLRSSNVGKGERVQ